MLNKLLQSYCQQKMNIQLKLWNEAKTFVWNGVYTCQITFQLINCHCQKLSHLNIHTIFRNLVIIHCKVIHDKQFYNKMTAFKLRLISKIENGVNVLICHWYRIEYIYMYVVCVLFGLFCWHNYFLFQHMFLDEVYNKRKVALLYCTLSLYQSRWLSRSVTH